MIIVTTPNIEGRPITQYLGIVTSDAIMGANIFRDVFAGVRNIVGGRSAAYEKELDKAKQTAFADMQARAQAMGADAIVAVDMDYETIGASMLMVSISGTAVKL